MNMLTSLKTLLFSSAAMKMPLAGDGTGMALPAGAVDFAALLDGSMKGEAVAVPGAPSISAGVIANEVIVEAAVVDAGADVSAQPATEPLSIAPDMPEKPVFPSIPSIVPDDFAEVEQPAATVLPVETPVAPVDGAENDEAPGQVAMADIKIIADQKPKIVMDHLPEQPAIALPAQEGKADGAEPVDGEEPVGKNEVKETDEDGTAVAPPVIPAPLGIVAPMPEMVRPAPVDQPAVAAKEGNVTVSAPPVPATARAVRPSNKPEVAVQPQAEPVVPDAARIAGDNVRAVADVGTKDADLTDKKPPIGPGKITSKEALSTTDDAVAAAPVAETILPSATPAGKLSRSEALALLQMVREQFARTSPEAAHVPEAIAATPHKGGPDSKPVVAEPAMHPAIAVSDADGVGATAPTQPQPVAAGVPVAAATVMPTVDVGASLGAQVVDMGVSGQWIDGLARDIAGLAQNGAHGRFQINASQLGPVQVDIRQGADGAAVSLTVANEAAEMALKQDSDRLRLDAGLAAVRIADVKIERMPHVTEAARPDGAGQSGNQQSGQQSSSQGSTSGWQGAGQGAGQSMTQSERQGHWQARENIASGLKGSADSAVINQKDAGDSAGDARRARYA